MGQTTQMTTMKEKANSLREFLSEPERMKAFSEALPKWLNVDRLMRVVFSSAMKNPKIFDCSKASILDAVLSCSTLGLEPILGRAYLIPYKNSKNINGKWVKVMECQFQVGYQGLIDLARRSGTIADINGYNVYENDEFDITFGMAPDIKHRPWYMFADRKDKGPGECLGAYCVWTLKDGTKHSEFMPISDIHKRRDSSMAYQSDVKYDKTDSPWLNWPEDMNLKTVIKHSSKMVPASIEFMEAVSYDDDVEVGKPTFNPFLGGGMGSEIGITEGSPPAPDISSIVKGLGLERERVNQFIDECTERFNSSEAEIIEGIIEDTDGFVEEFKKWESATFKQSLQDEIGGLKTTGLTAWETKHRGEVGGLPEDDKAFFLDKWQRVIGHSYDAEGQPGYKKTEAKPAGLFPPVDEEKERVSRLKLEFQKAMLEYRDSPDDGIGREQFYAVLRESGYDDITDVPEEEYASILQAMEKAR